WPVWTACSMERGWVVLGRSSPPATITAQRLGWRDPWWAQASALRGSPRHSGHSDSFQATIPTGRLAHLRAPVPVKNLIGTSKGVSWPHRCPRVERAALPGQLRTRTAARKPNDSEDKNRTAGLLLADVVSDR